VINIGAEKTKENLKMYTPLHPPRSLIDKDTCHGRTTYLNIDGDAEDGDAAIVDPEGSSNPGLISIDSPSTEPRSSLLATAAASLR
jgi:hypothetical protein